MNKAASALGRLAKGVPKTLTAEERERRRKAMQRVGLANKRRNNAEKVLT